MAERGCWRVLDPWQYPSPGDDVARDQPRGADPSRPPEPKEQAVGGGVTARLEPAFGAVCARSAPLDPSSAPAQVPPSDGAAPNSERTASLWASPLRPAIRAVPEPQCGGRADLAPTSRRRHHLRRECRRRTHARSSTSQSAAVMCAIATAAAADGQLRPPPAPRPGSVLILGVATRDQVGIGTG